MIDNKKIILFGASEKNYAEQIINKYGEQVVYCIDNDSNKHNTMFKDRYTIYPVEKILEEEKGTYIVIITAIYYFNKMASQLMSMGFERNIDFVFAGDILDIDSLKECWKNNKKAVDEDIKSEPRILQLEYSGACNLKCTYCPFHGEYISYKFKNGVLDFETLKVIVNKCKKAKTIDILIICGHGESFLNNNWYEFTDYILNEMSIKEVIIYTNGMLLTVENAQKLAKLKQHNIKLSVEVSVDGSTPEENNNFRLNSDYEIIKNNIYNALKYIDEKDICIANAFVIGEEELKRRDYDVTFSINTPDYILNDFSNLNSMARPIFNKTPKYKMVLAGNNYDNSIVKRNYQSSICDFLFYSLTIDSKGEIIKCACTNSTTPFIGNIFDDDPIDVFYNNTELNEARRMALEGKCPDFCRFCVSNPTKQYFVLTKKD